MVVHTGRLLRSITLPIKLTNGNGGRGNAFWQTAKDRKQFEQTLRQLGHVYEPLDHPVELRVTRLMGPRERLWDHSSGLRGNWKELEDAMVACGWFRDDGPDWIAAVSFAQRKHDRRESAVLIEMFAVE